MSHLYNPYLTDQQSSTQARYEHSSAQAQSDPQRTSYPNSGSSYRSAPSGHSPNIPSLLALPLPSFMAAQSRPVKEEEPKRSADIYSSKAREESLLLPRSYATTQPFQGHRKAVAEHSDRSLNWLPTYKSTNEDDASKYYTSAASSIFPGGGESRTSAAFSIFPGGGESRTSVASSIFPGGGESRTSAASSIFPGGVESRTSASSSIFSGGDESKFTTIGESKPHEQSIPGLGEYEFPVRDTASAQPEFSQHKYTSESAINILLHFGLEKEDLEQLISYPEDQITPQNLPFILRQIRQQKTKNPVSAVQAVPYPEPKPTTSMSDTDFRGHMKEVFHQDYRPRGILKTSKVIDYGHISQFSAGPGEEVGMASGAHGVGSSTLLMDSSGREAKEMSMSSLISHRDQESSVPGLYSPLNFKLSSASLSPKNPPKQFPPPPKQVPQTVSIPFTISKTDTDSRLLPGVSKSLSLKGPEPSHLSVTPSPSVTLGQHGLVLYDGLKDPRQPLKQVSKVPETKQQPPVKQEVKKQQPAAQRIPTPQVNTASNVPAPAQIYDYVAATPGMYPHSCSLCKKECLSVKEWINHQNTELHLRNCKLLRTRFPEWDGELLTSLSASDVDARFSSTRLPQSRKKRQSSSSRSRSQSYSPQRHRCSGSRRDQERSRYRSRSRSNSPHQRSRRTRRVVETLRSRSRSQSPLYRSIASRHRSRSRSYKRRSSPRRRDDSLSSAKRSQSREQRSSEKLSARQMASGSAEALAQKLLGSSAIQTLSNKSDLEAVVKTLAPALLAELTKMKTSPSSSSSSSASKKDPKTKTRTVSADDAASTVRLLGVLSSISHSHLEGTARLFGKPTSIVIFRELKEAQVVFEKPEDAEKMRNAKSHKLMGMRVKSSGGKLSGSQTPAQERKKAPPTKIGKSRMSSLSKAQNVPAKPAKVSESGKQKQAAGFTTPSSLSKAQNVMTKSAKVPKSGKHKRAASFTTPFSLSKAQNVMAMPAKAPKFGKQQQVAGSTTQSSTAKPSDTAADKKPAGEPMKPTVLNKPSQPAKSTTSGPQAPAADKKGSTSSEKKAEQKDKEAAVKVEKPPDKAEKSAGPPIMSTLEVLVKQESQEEKEKLSEEDADRKPKTDVLPLTMGEMMGKNLVMKRIACVEMKSVFSPEFASKNRRVLQITNLPKYENGNYTEQDVANLLTPFGFQHEDEHLHNIYVIPQQRMALAVLPTAEMVINVIRASVRDCFKLSGCKLLVKILEDNFSTPMEFYQSLMMWMNEKIQLHQAERIVFIKNISPSEARKLREVLKKIGNVRNYAPLLNKVFIEFYTIHDADRLGVWYSLLKKPPQHSVYRLGTPRRTTTSPLPIMAEKAIPSLRLRLKGSNVPMNSGVPLECGPPFYVTMTTFPFIFPTSCPWFSIPSYHNPFTVSSTIMMTCLPEDGYCQLDVARMVWSLLHQRNIISMFYRVMVLPLQRRAFIYFNTPESGREFSRRHSIKPYCLKDKPVKIHFVDHNMNPEFTEEVMYGQLMKLSNARVTPKSHLEHRLLLVQVSEVSLELIQAVMKEVASVGRLAGFLPLGNRICIEMLEPSDWMKVIQAKLGSLTAPHIWKKVIRVDTLQSLHKHQLQSVNFTINLEGLYWAAPGQTAQDSNTSSSSSTIPAAENTTPDSGSASETSKDVEMVEQESWGAVDTDTDVASSDDLTRTEKVPEGHTPSKKRPVVLTLSKHCHVVPTSTMVRHEGPKPSEVHHEGVKAFVEHPEHPAGLKPSKERPDGQTPSEKCIEFPTTSEDHAECPKPTKEHPEGTTPSKEYSERPTLFKERPEGPKPTEEHLEGSTPPKEASEDPTPFKESLEGPKPTEEHPEGSTLSKECSEGATSFKERPEGPKPTEGPTQFKEGPKPTEEHPEGSTPSKECSNGSTPFNKHLEGPKPTEKHPEGTTPSKKYSEGPTLFKECPEGPKLTEEHSEGSTPSKEASEDPIPFQESLEGPKSTEEHQEGSTPSKECSEGPIPFKEHPKPTEGPTPTEEHLEGSTLSKECSESPTPFQERSEGPKLTDEHPEGSTPSKECSECPTPFKERPEGSKLNKEHLEGSTPSKECSECPTLFKEHLEGPKPTEEHPEGSTPSKKCSDGPTPFKECLEGLKLSKVCSEGPTLSKEYPDGSTPSKECSEDLDPFEKQCEGLTPSEKYLECMMPSQKCPEGPAPSEEQSKGPILSGELSQGPTSIEEQSGSPTPSTKFSQGLTPTQELPQGPTLSEGLPQGPTLSEGLPQGPTLSEGLPQGPTLSEGLPQGPTLSEGLPQGPTLSEELPQGLTQTQELPQGLTLSEELLQCPIPTEKCPQGPTPIEELPQGPTSSVEQSEGSTRSEECPEGPTTSKHPKTEIEEHSPMGEDKIKAILAAIQQHKQTKGGKVTMDFTADVRFSDRDVFCFEQDTDEFVTLDEVSDDTKYTAKNTQSSNSSKRIRRRRGQMRSHSKTLEQESKSSNKSDRASERSCSPMSFQRRQRDSWTTTTRDKSWSPERRSHRGKDMSWSPERRSHRGRDKSRSPERRSLRSRDVSRSPEGRPYRDRDNSLTTERRSHRRKDDSRSPDRRSRHGRGKTLTTKHKSDPGKDKSPSNKCKENSSSTKRNSEPGEEESSSLESKERSQNTESRSEQEKSPISSLAALSAVGIMVAAVNTAAEPEKETPVEAPKEEEPSVTQSPKSEEKQEEEMENYQILDLFEENMEEEESRLPGPEEDQSLDGLSFQVLDSIDDEGNADVEESVEPQTDTSFQVLDSVTEDQTAPDHVTEVAAAENVSDETKVSNIAKRHKHIRGRTRRRKSKVLAANKNITVQENFEVIDSVKNPTETEHPEPISQAPKDVTPEAELKPIKEEEVYQVIDSIDEQSAPNAKKKQGRRGRPTRRSARGRTSEGESEEKQDETKTKSEATKLDSITYKEGAYEVPCTVLDSAGSETNQETQKVGRRRSTRGNKEKKITSQTASSKQEPKYQVIDSVEDDVALEEAVTVTRSTRGQRGRPAKRDISTRRQTAAKECKESKETSPKIEDTTVTVAEATYKVTDSVEDEGALDAPPVSEQDRKRGRPRNAKATSKLSSSKKAKVEIEEEPTYQIIDSVEEEVRSEDQEISYDPETAEKSSTPEDDYDKQKITKSVCEEDEEEPMYQIVDSVEDDQGQEETEDDPVPYIMIPGTIKGSTEGEEEHNDFTDFIEDKNNESSTLRSALLILDKEAKELEVNNEEPGSLSSIKESRSKVMAITSFEANELLTLDEVSVDEAPEEDGSERKEEGDQEDPRNQSISIEECCNTEMEMTTFEAQELLTLDEVSADEAPEESEEDGSERKEEGDQEDPRNQSISIEECCNTEMEMTTFEAQELLTLDEVSADEAPEESEEDGSERKDKVDQEEPGSQSISIEKRRSKEMEITALEAQELLTLDEVGADEAPEEGMEDGSKRKEEGNQEEPKNQSSSIEERRNMEMEVTAVDAQELLTLDEVSADEAPEEPEEDGSERKKEGDQEEPGCQSSCIAAYRSKEMEISAFEAQELLTLDEVTADEDQDEGEEDGSERKEEVDNEEPPGSQSSRRKARMRKGMNMTKIDIQELLTLDEVGADDVPDERDADGSEQKEGLKQEADLRNRSSSRERTRRKEVEMDQVETQELLTLDEVGADDAPEQPEVERPEPKNELPIYNEEKDGPISESGQSLNPLKSETLAEVDMEKDEDHRHDDDITEESDFIMLDEAVDDEEEVDPRPNAATSGRKEGKVYKDEETQTKESLSDKLAASPSMQQISIAEAEASGQSDKGATVSLKGQCEVKVVDKRRKELVGPEAKRSRSQSPDVPADFTLPTYNPCNPLGQEFVVPKAGFFCNICSIFYINENTAKEVHCTSRRHYDNLKKYYLKLKTTSSRASSPTSSNVSLDGV
ncbi:uncharacterized protein LOC114480104 isoform X2 [Gouania willdenowi]|uniref:uncharacterized protein LOC114480104 isoform X2 n=1 Tax=Gouania willdenowi TaxID=441366 RepID=UPI001054F11D|nr:uncharacterized protein LOC114480104 isoform X2 [Gouania willdenowi]